MEGERTFRNTFHLDLSRVVCVAIIQTYTHTNSLAGRRRFLLHCRTTHFLSLRIILLSEENVLCVCVCVCVCVCDTKTGTKGQRVTHF